MLFTSPAEHLKFQFNLPFSGIWAEKLRDLTIFIEVYEAILAAGIYISWIECVHIYCLNNTLKYFEPVNQQK